MTPDELRLRIENSKTVSLTDSRCFLCNVAGTVWCLGRHDAAHTHICNTCLPGDLQVLLALRESLA